MMKENALTHTDATSFKAHRRGGVGLVDHPEGHDGDVVGHASPPHDVVFLGQEREGGVPRVVQRKLARSDWWNDH